MSLESAPDIDIDRIDINKVSVEEFIDKYERPYKPVIILNAQNDWLAKEKWTLEVIVNQKLLTIVYFLMSVFFIYFK